MGEVGGGILLLQTDAVSLVPPCLLAVGEVLGPSRGCVAVPADDVSEV